VYLKNDVGIIEKDDGYKQYEHTTFTPS